MNWFTRLFSSRPEADQAEFREAYGHTVDPDEDDWRPLTTDTRRDLDPVSQSRMQKLSVYLWESNLLANRLIELPIAYLLAKGVKITIDDEDLQKVLDRHWNDGLNAWDIKLPKKVRELSIFGEQCWPAFVNEVNGFVRVGYLDPELIETVVMDPDNREQPIGIVTKKNRKGVAWRFRVIVNVPEMAFAPRARQIRESFTDGDVFFFQVNDLCRGTRGRGDLLPQIDWLDAYDQFLFGELDRADFMRAFIWDVTLKGATQEDVEARARKIVTPKPGSVRVHNDSEEWDAVTPELKAADAAAGARLFRNHMLGGATVPEHWFGGAEDVNRATGQAMHEPTEKMLEMRQCYLGYMLTQVGVYVIRQHWMFSDSRQDSELSDEEAEILNSLSVEWPEMTARDTTKYASALQSAVVSASMAIAEGLITRSTAINIVQAMAAELGVPFDVEAELEAVEKEMDRIHEEDGFVPDPAARDPDPE